jgi:transcriptional regulator with XRE-family HTH domain
MTTIDEIHRENLELLAAEAGGKGVLAERLGKSASQVSQWLNGSADSKTGKARGIRPASCRAIEIAFEKPVGWMDISHAVVESARQPSTAKTKLGQKSDSVTPEEIIELITLFKDAPPGERKKIVESARLHKRRK